MFIRNSEIQLDEFLLPEVFQEIKQDFTSSDINWQMVGPSNIRYVVKIEWRRMIQVAPEISFVQAIFPNKKDPTVSQFLETRFPTSSWR